MKRLIKSTFEHTRREESRPAKFTVACLAMLAVGLTFGGCGKDDESATVKPEELVPVSAEAPPDVQEKARITQSTAIYQGIEPPAPTLKLRGGELATPEVLAAYNQELLRHMVKTKDVPETLDHLKRSRELPKLPTAPAGQRIVYDPTSRTIKLESR